MLGNKQAVATVAVKDLAVARKFYEGVLGLGVASAQGGEAITFSSGSSSIIVYRSQYAGTNNDAAVGRSRRPRAVLHHEVRAAAGQGGDRVAPRARAPRAPMDKVIKEIALQGDGLVIRDLEVRETSGDWTRTVFTEVDVNHRYDAARNANRFGGSGAALESHLHCSG